MSEYVMNHTGEQLDEAIDKVLNGYIKPEREITVTENTTSPEDVADVKWLNVNVSTEPIIQYVEKPITLSSNITASSSYNSSSIVADISDINFNPKFYIFSPYDYNTSISLITASTSTYPIISLCGLLDNEISLNLGSFLSQGSTYYNKASSSATSVVATQRAGISVKNSSLKLSPNNEKLYYYNSSANTAYPLKAGKWRLTLIGW